MPERKEVYELIDSERSYQEERWHGHKHSPQEWLTYIRDYCEEALHVGTREDDATCLPKQMANIRKIGALAVAAMEQHPTLPRFK